MWFPYAMMPSLRLTIRSYNSSFQLSEWKLQIMTFFIVVPCCMLSQYLLYCSNSCTSLHFKTLKHLKSARTCFGLLWNHLQGVRGRTLLGYWIGMLIYICYKECWYVAVCQFIPSVCVWGYHLVETSLDQIGTHTHGWNELTYSHIPTLFITNVNQHSNLVT